MNAKILNGTLNLLRLYDKKQNNYRKMFYAKLSNSEVVTLNELNKQAITNELIESINTIRTFNGREIYLPKKLFPDLLYFLGVVAGDGSLPIKHNGEGQRNYVVSIEKANRYFILIILKPLAEGLFKIKWSWRSVKRYNRKRKWILYLYSKPLYFYLTKIFDFPEGKKHHKIRMPELIRKLRPINRIPFIAGVMDTDWGRTGENKFGTHCASEKLLFDIRNTLKHFLSSKMKIKRYVQKGKYISYQMNIPKSHKPNLFKLLQTHFPLRNPKRIKLFAG